MSEPTKGVPVVDNPFRHVYLAGLPQLLEDLGCSLLVSTYQAGKLVVIRAAEGRISTLLRGFEQPMGIAADGQCLAIGTRGQVWFLRNDPEIGRQLEPPGRHDACFLPRSCHVTGDIRVHEVAWAGDGLWLVNTRFSCLCTLHPDSSFVPRWRPPFITDLAAEDRCHLNGLAVADGRPKYVTAFGETNTPEGWRPDKPGGGVLIDVPTGEVVARGLCMPHSPRVRDGWVWLLDSGTGRLLVLDPTTGRPQTVTSLPGYARGLAFLSRGVAQTSSAVSGYAGWPRHRLRCLGTEGTRGVPSGTGSATLRGRSERPLVAPRPRHVPCPGHPVPAQRVSC